MTGTILTEIRGFQVFWVLAVFVGVVCNAYTAWAALQDARWVKRASNNQAKHIQAWQSARREVVLFFFQSIVFFIRFWSIFWPLPARDRIVNPDVAMTIETFLRNWAVDATIMTVGQLLLALDSYLNLRDRRRVLARLRDRITDTAAAPAAARTEAR